MYRNYNSGENTSREVSGGEEIATETETFDSEKEVDESRMRVSEQPEIKKEELKTEDKPQVEVSTQGGYYVMLKDVGEPYLDRFGLSPRDYTSIKAAGVDIIASNFDICATPSDVVTFLDSAYSAGLKVVMPAGSGEAEWGYPCEENFSDALKPRWEKEKVQAWVKKWSYHPAILAWDISNEGGQNFPNAQERREYWAREGYALTVTQLQQAYKDVKEADPYRRPIMIRMNGWFFYDYDSNFFREGNPFGPNIADIVMINAYSNVDEYFTDFVSTVSVRANNSIKAINPDAKIIISLGAWEEPPLWRIPSFSELSNDVAQAKSLENLYGIAIFKYGAEESEEWWLPREGVSVWNAIKSGILR